MGIFDRFTKKKDSKDEKPGTALVRAGEKTEGRPDSRRPLIGDSQGGQPKMLPGGMTDVSSPLGGPSRDDDHYEDLAGYAEIGVKAGAGVLVGGTSEINIAILLDATGSMEPLIGTAKTNVRRLMALLLKSMKIKIMMAVYRDYCDYRHEIYAASPLTDNATQLYDWLDTVQAFGGGDTPEAIEYALHQLEDKGFHMVVVCGDAPSHSPEEILAQTDTFGIPADGDTAKKIAARLYAAETPVHMLVVGNYHETVTDFQQIAQAGGGQQGDLDGGTSFLDMIAMAALHRAGGTGAVQEYMHKRGKELSPGAGRFGMALVRFLGGKSSK